MHPSMNFGAFSGLLKLVNLGMLQNDTSSPVRDKKVKYLYFSLFPLSRILHSAAHIEIGKCL